MKDQIKKFDQFISLLEGKNFLEISKDPIIYKGYYIILWPFRNEGRHPDMKWGYTISDDPEGKNYIAKTRGPAGNYEESLNGAQSIIDNQTSKSIQ